MIRWHFNALRRAQVLLLASVALAPLLLGAVGYYSNQHQIFDAVWRAGEVFPSIIDDGLRDSWIPLYAGAAGCVLSVLTSAVACGAGIADVLQPIQYWSREAEKALEQ